MKTKNSPHEEAVNSGKKREKNQIKEETEVISGGVKEMIPELGETWAKNLFKCGGEENLIINDRKMWHHQKCRL